MEYEQANKIGFGVPFCPCGRCIAELEDENGDIIVTMKTFREWIAYPNECPMMKNPNPPPGPGPGTPMRTAA